LHYKTEEINNFITLIKREALLHQAVLYWRNFHLLLEKDQHKYYKLFLKQLQDHSGLIFIAGESDWHPPHEITSAYKFISQLLPRMDAECRHQLWQQVLPDAELPDLKEIAQIFQLTPRQIFTAATKLKQRPNYLSASLVKANLYSACHGQANQYLSTLAHLIKPSYKREDIILPAYTEMQLDEIINYVKHKNLVLEQWGFGNKLALGKGLNALFSGSPGTGKTMAAEIIASSLNLKMYKIDLSNIVSKYIGETEKNLSRIFHEAENSQIILFFDEADALFGKRSEVQDAHDRYANIETSYLLQKIEEHPGIVILATNFKRNLDEAFIRRLHFSLDFPFPAATERLQIWQQIWPQHIKLSDEINLEKIAKQLEITGGNIRNIALTAAFKAAADSEKLPLITKEHLLYAIEREYRKMGKVIIKEKFNELLA
jgi:AAA+ superfamily predicted ATPase